MNNSKFLLIPTLLLALASCAPAAATTGRKVYSPTVVSQDMTASAVAGQTVYLQYTYPNSLVKVPAYRFDELRFEANGRSTDGGIVSQEGQAPWLHMKAESLPSGWNVTLEKATLVKRATRTTEAGNYSTVYYFPEVIVVYKVVVPADATSAVGSRLNFFDGSDPIGSTTWAISIRQE